MWSRGSISTSLRFVSNNVIEFVQKNDKILIVNDFKSNVYFFFPKASASGDVSCVDEILKVSCMFSF